MTLFYFLLVFVLPVGIIYFSQSVRPIIDTHRNLSHLGQGGSIITQDGITFRDLYKNGKLDPYEDRAFPPTSASRTCSGR